MNTSSGSLITSEENFPAEMQSFVSKQYKTPGSTALTQRKASSTTSKGREICQVLQMDKLSAVGYFPKQVHKASNH